MAASLLPTTPLPKSIREFRQIEREGRPQFPPPPTSVPKICFLKGAIVYIVHDKQWTPADGAASGLSENRRSMNARTRFSDFYDKFHDGIIPEPCHLQIHGEPPVLAVAIPEQAEYTPMTKLNMDRQDRLWPLFAYFRTRKIDMGRMMPQHVLIRKDAGDLPWNGGSLVIDLQILLVHAMDGTQEARWRDIRENYEIGRAYLDALIDRFRQSLPDGPPVIPQSFDGGKIARWMCQELDTDRGEVCLKTHASRAELEDHLRQHGVPEELIAGELVEDDYWDMETLARGPSGAASPRLRPTHTARERPPRPSKVHDSQSSSYESNTTID